MTKLKRGRRGLDCLSCTYEMIGIHSYDARKECVACGGKALIAQKTTSQRLGTDKRKAA